MVLLAVCPATAQVGNRGGGPQAGARPGIVVTEKATGNPAPSGGVGPAPGQRTGRGIVLPWGAGWGWGWNGTNVIVQEREVEKEPSFRPWVENKEYKRELLNPITRDFPEGTLPAPKLERLPRTTPCRLVLTGGERIESDRCERRADLVSYVDGTGRRTWLSTDLVDWRQSRFGADR
jgi:hypothetical protein